MRKEKEKGLMSTCSPQTFIEEKITETTNSGQAEHNFCYLINVIIITSRHVIRGSCLVNQRPPQLKEAMICIHNGVNE